ncbi:MAG: hypothetical protein CMG55_07075 [Candidatus Marinimicrobia bacterium]|nr:hypothetical protein [Candidatus Neomarinimicrobiota bacterium]
MKKIHLITFFIFALYGFFGLSCDDRVPTGSTAAVESGTLELSYVFIHGETSNPTIVGEVLSDPSAKSSIMVIARLLDSEGNGVNSKSLQFSSDVAGSFDTSDPSTKYVPNFKEYGFPNKGGNGYAYARFTPADGIDKIVTAASSGAIITVKYTTDIIDNVEFSIFNSKDLVWPYTMNITAESQIGLGESSAFEVLLQNKYGDELSGVRLIIESENGSIACGDTCYTDATGRVNTTFESYGFSENVGPGNVNTSFYHPSITDTVTVAKQIVIGTESAVGSCAYIEIPSSNPSEIVVKDGGGIESTDIKAEIYDSNGNLLTTPVTVNFRLEPVLAGCYLNSPDVNNVNVESVNGVATVSLNSGTEPGPVRIIATANTAETSICDSSNTELESVTVPVIIASGAPYHIEAEYDPNSTEAIGGGFYQTECAAIVYDRWYNPVEDSTYVYWNINPLPPDTLIDAFVEGVSYTNNEGILSGTATSGVARSNIVYSTDAIGDIGQVRALTFGTNGDSIASYINEGQGDATLFFLPGQVSLLANATYWDFSLNGNPALIQVSALVIDFYGNPVVDAPVAFSGTGVNNWFEFGYEAYVDEGVLGAGAADGCFSWRDYGADDDPETLDMGTFNEKHDSFDIDGDGLIDTAEVSEPFDDFGQDGVDGTFDEGEGNGYWDGYSMINCEAVVRTDADGYARIIVEFDQALCTLANVDDTTNPSTCTYDDFTASLSATLLIPEITTSDPLDILLVRSPAACP